MSNFVKALIFAAVVGIGLYWYNNQPTVSSSSKKAIPQEQSVRDKVSSLIMLHIPGTDPNVFSEQIRRYKPAGIILMSDNIPSDLSQLPKLIETAQKASETPLLISIDQEGCTVKRIQSDEFPCAQDLKNSSDQEVTDAFKKRSELLKQNKVNLNFGIVADITNDKKSFIYPRVFGSDATTTGNKVRAAVVGSKNLTYSTIKHFPGHGETDQNSHNVIPVVTVSQSHWDSYDKVPFTSGIEAGAEFVMMGHLIYTSVDSKPASLSEKWHELLRNEMNFTGVIITDDMIMLQKSGEKQYEDPAQNAIAALQAGNNIILFVNEYNLEEEPVRHIDIDRIIEKVTAAVQSGTLSENTINASAAKVKELRSSLLK